jgi:hypothetical protein
MEFMKKEVASLALAPKLIQNKVISDRIWETLSNPNES